jgi:hypothetical protein
MLPATLQEDEAARFCAALPAGARDSALLLLRSLLHPDPAQRPRHAIQISRMLHAIQGMQPERNYLDVTDPVRGMRPPPPTAGKPCGAHDVARLVRFAPRYGAHAYPPQRSARSGPQRSPLPMRTGATIVAALLLPAALLALQLRQSCAPRRMAASQHSASSGRWRQHRAGCT